MSVKSAPFKFDNTVLMHIIKLVQLSMMTGTDCADLMQSLRVVPADDDPHVLHLTEDYRKGESELIAGLLARVDAAIAAHNGDDDEIIAAGAGQKSSLILTDS